MESKRQESFKRLRTPCVELSAVGLAFRGNNSSAADLTRALEPLHYVLEDLSEKNSLDEKLAEYAFFPLTNIFNQTQRLPVRCIELAVKCLHILVAYGWRDRLVPALGKQLIILLTLIVGGSPNNVDGKEPLKAQAAEELSTAGFECLNVIFEVLEGPVAEQTIFHEIGTATVVDQTVYILLEGLVDQRSDDVCISAAKAMKALYARISDRVVLASIMPRTVSALAKVLKPTTQVRRSYKLLQISLRILNYLLKSVLNDHVAATIQKPKLVDPQSETLALDQAWLKATTTQIKLALVNVIQVRRHQRHEVQTALLELCVMVIEDCQVTLKDAISLMTDTIVVLADKEYEEPNDAYKTLLHLTTTYPVVLESLKESLHNWLVSFPRIMKSSDETAKQWGIRQISTAFQVISQVQSGSEMLTNSLASGLSNSVSAVVKLNTNILQPLASVSPEALNLDIVGPDYQSLEFPSVLLEHQSQQQTLKDLRSMIIRLNLSESGNEITRFIVNQIRSGSNETVVSSFWLALTSLRSQSQSMAIFDDFLEDNSMQQSFSVSNRATMIDELYYNALIILTELPADGSGDWRALALALEAVALQAQQLGEAFRPELMDALYPTLQLLASNNSSLQRHAMICLNVLTQACNYPDTSTMIIENVDYLVNSVALKLNTFDVSPYPPQVLFMMVKLSGPRLVPYLDDVVDSIFGIIDLYHGYPKLVEMLFKCLAAIVAAGSQKPSLLTIDDGRESGPHDHRKSQIKHLSISALAANIANRKAKRAMHDAEEGMDDDGVIPHPKKPWSETYEKPPTEPETIEELLNKIDADEPLPPPKEPEDAEKPLSKTHSLLLHIVKSIPSHLSSPSPYLRRSLLAILIDTLPTLSKNENSFLPLINDLWNSVASRIIFPSSLASESSSNSLISQSSNSTRPSTQPDTQAFQEETFVITTACQAIEAMCKGAGDFMATRIEPEFPRWDRLYQRVWTKVRQDAEAANNRRNRQQRNESRKPTPPASLIQSVDFESDNLYSDLPFTSSLALTTPTPGSSAFTSHHSLWRALISLFLTILTRVRLPLETGDRICEILGAWISLFVGPEYYFQYHSGTDSRSVGASGLDPAQQSMLGSVNDAIHSMETWNADLTWFIFVHEKNKAQSSASTGSIVEVQEYGMSVEVDGEVLEFA
ncbi:Armadillo-like helical [Penicillium angulare]|uniref:Armadillo-like helical n=1 Tax=Penicillium angulare TaxID=116970 RepID=UPI00254251A8|nr:Armadillo-like helical [Penicillium angulare]KAJ5287154.1 Armadillo-like helical [Penicillium angulare]